MRKTGAITTLMVSLLVAINLITAVSLVQPVKSITDYYPSWARIAIMPDGTVKNYIDNSSVPIQQNGNVYTLTGDLYGSLDIEANNVIVDGAGHKIQYPGENAPSFGVTIYGGSNVTLMNTQITGFHYPVTLNSFMGEGSGSSNCVISNNTMTGSIGYWNVAIWVNGFNNVISGNTIIGNDATGIFLDRGSGNVISDNYIADNTVYGISFMNASATLRNNRLNNNSLGAFDFLEGTYGSPGQDIDSSNLVDGMPVYYAVNQQNKTGPSNSGYVLLVNCANMTVRGLSITKDTSSEAVYNSNGIHLVNTINSKIVDNTLTVGKGIICYWSRNISITKNTLTTGIQLHSSNISVTDNTLITKGMSIESNTTVARNNITSCDIGISLESAGSQIFENNIVECNTGISLFSSFNNTLFHNNFINNSHQVYIEHYGGSPWDMYISHTYFPSENNSWDVGYPAGGNYWSDYDGVDTNGDMLGDTPYLVFENDTDRYPLMQPFGDAFKTYYLLATTPPKISISSPLNQTYKEASVPLVFLIDKPVNWISYSLDGQENISIVGNCTVSDLANGSHNVTIYCNDTYGNMAASETVIFTISQPFPIVPVAAGSVAVVVVTAAGLLAYFKKRKKELSIKNE
jgi:parallel beta-helix repeat protein